ncbi:MAG TPA: hypothetical protein VFP80_05120 [Thermoanaerobaculia bacterium]|nr:hypothetical protein [Thermoanaerobaculia bacterium]
MRRTLLPLLVLGLFAESGQGQTPGYTRFLVPVFGSGIPGAYGTLWRSETWLRYAGLEEMSIAPGAFCRGAECTIDGWVAPNLPAIPFEGPQGPLEPAILVHVETQHAAAVTFESRLRELSRSADSAGTEVPVIREDRMSSGPLYLLNVPMKTPSRYMLRLYGLPDVAEREVEIRYFRQPSTSGPNIDLDLVLLRVDRVALRSRESFLPWNFYPALAEIGSLELFPELAAEDAIWIEVVPLSAGLRIWAMLSITNNTTQQVTLVTPGK